MMNQKTIEKGKIGGWRPNSGRKPGFIGYWKGKKRPDMLGNTAIIKFGSENVFSKLKYQAEKHPRWKGGTWMYWRKKALIRDNYTCKSCGLYDVEIMEVDHIIPKKITGESYQKGTHNLDNLMTLCPNCHTRKTLRERREKAKGKNFYSL